MLDTSSHHVDVVAHALEDVASADDDIQNDADRGSDPHSEPAAVAMEAANELRRLGVRAELATERIAQQLPALRKARRRAETQRANQRMLHNAQFNPV